jgi:YD repeat-containing protein
MNKTNKILALLLIVQIALLMAITLWPDSESKASDGEALFTKFASEQVTQVQIADGSDQQITLQKNVDDQWVLPDYGNYPVEASRVTRLLDKIASLDTGRLITQSETSHRRLNVADDSFGRLVEIELADGSNLKLYIGNSGGGTTSYIRAGGDNRVYMVDNVAQTDAPTQVSGWINTVYFNVSPDQITDFTLHNSSGDLAFSQQDSTWTMAGLGENETFNQDNFNTLLSQIAAVRMVQPIGKDEQDSFGMEAPRATITIHTVEQDDSTSADATPEATPEMVQHEYTVMIGAEQENGVVVKSSESEYYALISTTSAQTLLDQTRDGLVTVQPEATAEPEGTAEPN